MPARSYINYMTVVRISTGVLIRGYSPYSYDLKTEQHWRGVVRLHLELNVEARPGTGPYRVAKLVFDEVVVPGKSHRFEQKDAGGSHILSS